MYKKTCIIVALCLSLAMPSVALAWNAAGHMLVAMIAYEKMTAPQQQAMVALLKKHPRFKEDFADRMPPEVRKQPQAIQDKWIFMHASTWPDIARGFKEAVRTKYHHGQWHYINVPIFLTDEDRSAMEGKLPVNIDREGSAAQTDPQNIAQAYRKCMRDLTSRETSDADKAVALCWMLHLVGDVHQPLHACALFSRVQFPAGDHGGNYLLVNDRKALHSYWDGLMGDDTSLATLTKLREELKKGAEEEKTGPAAIRTPVFDRWIDESFKLANEQVYTAEMRHIVKENKMRPEKKVVDVGDLTPAYDKEAHLTAQKRMVEAGYRLATALETAH